MHYKNKIYILAVFEMFIFPYKPYLKNPRGIKKNSQFKKGWVDEKFYFTLDSSHFFPKQKEYCIEIGSGDVFSFGGYFNALNENSDFKKEIFKAITKQPIFNSLNKKKLLKKDFIFDGFTKTVSYSILLKKNKLGEAKRFHYVKFGKISINNVVYSLCLPLLEQGKKLVSFLNENEFILLHQSTLTKSSEFRVGNQTTQTLNGFFHYETITLKEKDSLVYDGEIKLVTFSQYGERLTETINLTLENIIFSEKKNMFDYLTQNDIFNEFGKIIGTYYMKTTYHSNIYAIYNNPKLFLLYYFSQNQYKRFDLPLISKDNIEENTSLDNINKNKFDFFFSLLNMTKIFYFDAEQNKQYFNTIPVGTWLKNEIFDFFDRNPKEKPINNILKLTIDKLTFQVFPDYFLFQTIFSYSDETINFNNKNNLLLSFAISKTGELLKHSIFVRKLSSLRDIDVFSSYYDYEYKNTQRMKEFCAKAQYNKLKTGEIIELSVPLLETYRSMGISNPTENSDCTILGIKDIPLTLIETDGENKVRLKVGFRNKFLLQYQPIEVSKYNKETQIPLIPLALAFKCGQEHQIYSHFDTEINKTVYINTCKKNI